MKKLKQILFTLFCLSICQYGIAQEKLAPNNNDFYDSVLKSSSSYKAFEINFKKSDLKSKGNYQAALDYAETLALSNSNKNQSLSQNAPFIIKLEFPFKEKVYSCTFQQNHLKSTSYQLTTSIDSKKESQNAIFYRGIIEGEPNSWATLSYFDGKYKILLAHSKGNLELTHAENDMYLAYESSAQKHIPDFACHYIDKAIDNNSDSQASSARIGSDCLELYIECDFQSYQDNGSSVAATEAWALSIINDVSMIYNTINIPLVISETFIWNSSDPYASLPKLAMVRDSFVAYTQNNYTGRIAQLFSTRPMDGGLAYGIGGLCGEYQDFPGPYSIATGLSTTYDPYPNFSFTVNVVAHELGHNLGARHTHACVWGPNKDAQIDDCGNVYATNNNGTPEGSNCYDELNPLLPMMGGTVMSFCNLEGGGIDLANGFGTEVGNFIFDQYNTAPCATGGPCASIPPSNDNCINAIELSLKGACFYANYDNIMSTASGVANPSCGTPGSGQDVWFKVVLQNTDIKLLFNSIPNEVEDAIITVYTGDCGNLTEIICQEAFNQELEIKVSGLSANDTIYIRIIESGSDVEGEFQLCVTDDILPCHPAFNPLVQLYNDTNGAAWANNSGWILGAAGTDCNPCSWYGVTCDNQLNVIGIDLYNNNLIGTVPSNMNQLTKLRTLRLLVNDLSGSFPDIWADMADLEFLDLSNNLFTGGMPASLGALNELTTLYIENNDMTGPLLPALGDLPNINVFWVKGNDFSGCYPGSYLNLCDIGSSTFINNPQLPGNGDFPSFCSDGTGGDIDEDGFCLGIGPNDDCDDNDNTTYPTAPEICDGKDNDCNGLFDEGISATNTWLPIGGGDWLTAVNWSQNEVPKPCEDIIIPSSVSVRMITIPNGMDAFARSLFIGTNSTLINDGNLYITGSDGDGLQIEQNGTLTNNGILNILNVLNNGILADGQINNNGLIEVSNLSTINEVHVQMNGGIENTNGGQIVIR